MITRTQARWTAVLLAVLLSVAAPGRGKETAAPPGVDADRWLEIDLRWFDRGEIERSSREFWQRFVPLFESVSGTRGVILNVGWLVDPILHWGGDLDAPIPRPAATESEDWTGVAAWTYADLARLAELLRQTAARQHGLEGVKVGMFALGWESLHLGAKTRFGVRHPEAFRPGGREGHVFDPGARLEADRHQYGAYPAGVPVDLTAGELFGAQWGSLSRAVGLDAIVLRDGALLAGRHRRPHPDGLQTPSDPAAVAAWSRAVANLVRYTKQANPRALVMGYSSAASALADWHVNFVDLETVAREGHLDAFIDQTRAGPSRGAGTSEGFFWRSPALGGTHHLAHVLLHAAILAETPARHYVLTETFSSRESPQGIQTARGRLRWGIWAYHHAALRRPGGLDMPAGTYVSWGNQGPRLLPEEDVLFLAKTLDDAIRDARSTREVYGPTLVYNRAASEWLMKTDPGREIGQWIDDVVGAVIRWPVPILSAARIEDLPDLGLELPILQTPTRLAERELAFLLERMAAGRPVALVGSPAGGFDGAVARAAGLESADTDRGAPRRRAAVLTPVPGITDGLPDVFATYQPFAQHVAGPTATVVHAVDGSPTLVMNLRDGRRVLAWDPPDLEVEPVTRDGPMGTVVPWVTVARVLNLWLQGGQGPWVDRVEPDQPASLTAWRLDDGSRRILAGDLEEGFEESTAAARAIEVSLPAAWLGGGAAQVRDVWGETALRLREGRLPITLGPAESRLVAVE